MKYQSNIRGVRRKKRRSGGIILLIIAICACIFAYDLLVDMGGKTTQSQQISVTIPSGSGIKQISKILKTNKIIKYPFAFKVVAMFKSDKYQLGMHTLSSSMSYSEILDILSQTGGIENGVKVIIPEGFEIRQIIEELVSSNLIQKDEFEAALVKIKGNYEFTKNIKRGENPLEGYLFPATYVFTPNMSETDIANKMLEKFNLEFSQKYYDRAKQLKMSVDEVITLASVIEREAASADELKTVSSVFHNRLKKSMALESCATVQYILKERKPVLTVADTKIKSPYNTYINKGLPIGPIASPGKAAIEAALYPENTSYLFFVAKSDGTHIFSKTYEEHQKAMKAVGL